MPGKAATPTQIAEVIAYREAGFTVAMIAEKTRLSFSTVNRIIADNKAKKGVARQALVEQARGELRSLIKDKRAIADEAARLIGDDLAHARHLRERLASVSEQLVPSGLDEAAIAMRAIAAMSTALKNTSDMVRHSLAYDKCRDEQDDEDLPVLQVLELDDEQIRKMREGQAAEDAANAGDEPDDAILSES